MGEEKGQELPEAGNFSVAKFRSQYMVYKSDTSEARVQIATNMKINRDQFQKWKINETMRRD